MGADGDALPVVGAAGMFGKPACGRSGRLGISGSAGRLAVGDVFGFPGLDWLGKGLLLRFGKGLAGGVFRLGGICPILAGGRMGILPS